MVIWCNMIRMNSVIQQLHSSWKNAAYGWRGRPVRPNMGTTRLHRNCQGLLFLGSNIFFLQQLIPDPYLIKKNSPHLAEAIVMKLIVFNAPCFRQHPIEPILDSSPEGPQGEAAAAEAASAVGAVVATVAGMVAHHGPGTVGPQTQKDDGDGIHRSHPHATQTNPWKANFSVAHIMIIFSNITYGPHKAVAEVSNHNEPIGRKSGIQLVRKIRKSMDFTFSCFVSNWVTD